MLCNYMPAPVRRKALSSHEERDRHPPSRHYAARAYSSPEAATRLFDIPLRAKGECSAECALPGGLPCCWVRGGYCGVAHTYMLAEKARVVFRYSSKTAMEHWPEHVRDPQPPLGAGLVVFGQLPRWPFPRWFLYKRD